MKIKPGQIYKYSGDNRIFLILKVIESDTPGFYLIHHFTLSNDIVFRFGHMFHIEDTENHFLSENILLN